MPSGPAAAIDQPTNQKWLTVLQYLQSDRESKLVCCLYLVGFRICLSKALQHACLASGPWKAMAFWKSKYGTSAGNEDANGEALAAQPGPYSWTVGLGPPGLQHSCIPAKLNREQEDDTCTCKSRASQLELKPPGEVSFCL